MNSNDYVNLFNKAIHDKNSLLHNNCAHPVIISSLQVHFCVSLAMYPRQLPSLPHGGMYRPKTKRTLWF